MNAKIETAIAMLGEQGRRAESCIVNGEERFQIDYRERVVADYGGSGVSVSFGRFVLATPQEMEELAEGVYSPLEFIELCLRRRADEKRSAEG